MIRRLLLLAICAASLRAATVAASSGRGAGLFQTLACYQCHSVNGEGGNIAPDLGLQVDRDFTPAALAAPMWNHAPPMWSAMRERGVQAGDLNEQAAADLLAFFYSSHYFDKPGDAGRGKRLFSSKHCADCHGLTSPVLPEAKPVSQWRSIGHPIVLVNAMWNHAVNMRQEFARRKFPWAQLTSQELADILVYLRNLPATHDSGSGFEITSGAGGAALFRSKGCVNCHKGKLDLPPLLKGKTLTDIAVAMWNHEPRMAPNPPRLEIGEMRELISYLWAGQFFEDSGNPSAGARVFASKHCATCHGKAGIAAGSGAPPLTGGGQTYTGATMISALWHHGPRMLEMMRAKGIAWQRFNAGEMSNLIAYLDSKNGEK